MKDEVERRRSKTIDGICYGRRINHVLLGLERSKMRNRKNICKYK